MSTRQKLIPTFICLLLTIASSGKTITEADPMDFYGIQWAVPYRLAEGSLLIDNIGLGPPIIVPIHGGFWLRPTEHNLLFSHFAVGHLHFAGSDSISEYTGRGEGKYLIGGEVALLHQMTLKVNINERRDVPFDSKMVTPQMRFPWIELDLTEVFPDPNIMPYRFFQLHLVAVPWPSMWFSTEYGFHPSRPDVVRTSYASDGDLLYPAGVVVRTNNQLTANLGIMPAVPDLGLDAVLGRAPISSANVGPAGDEIWFSIEYDIFSETLGELGNGDLLSDAGRIVRKNYDFIKPFSPMPPVVDFGLDAITLGPDGVLLFSTEEDFFSERLGRSIGYSDLLSEDGRIFKSIGDLMANFTPIEPRPIRFGVDAAYVWPHGEVWFSTEESFAEMRWGHIGHGDLLSDTGRIVARNLELLGSFKPVEDLDDFGLDALHVLWPCPCCDLDYDCDIDLRDLAFFSRHWRESDCGPCGGAELTGDGKVSLDDLREFVASWLAGVK